VKSIYRYTTNDGYTEMNGFLRGTSTYPPQDAARIQRNVDDAVAGLSKLPQATGTYYRGTDFPPDVLNRWQPGNDVSDPAFWSTSTKPSVAEVFRSENNGNVLITILGGSRGVDVRALSHYGGEAEVLLLPGAEFRVISREWDPGGFWRMSAKEIIDVVS